VLAIGVEGGFWASDACEGVGVVEGDGVGDFLEWDGFFVWVGGFDQEAIDRVGLGAFDLADAHGFKLWLMNAGASCDNEDAQKYEQDERCFGGDWHL